LIKSFPDPGYAQNTLDRFREVNRDVSPKEEEILFLLSSYSHFLGRMIIKDPKILECLIDSEFSELKKGNERLIEEASQIQDRSRSEEVLMSDLRRYKYRELSRIIYRDINKLAPFREIMEELSDLGCAIVEAVFRFYSGSLQNRHDDRFAIIGMGKLGGRELNLSSDIDIVYLYKDTLDSAPYFRLAERITRALSSVTEDGFLYRVDLGLRPGGGKSSIAVSLESALEHYFYWGDTWERAALIKARSVAGDLSLGDKFIEQIEPFVYKKFLDYASLEDLKDMKTKLDRLHKKRDVKLGRGGIREVEFFVQAHQLITGGEVKDIRERNTIRAIEKLLKRKIINKQLSDILSNCYLFLRSVEHAIQLVDELQTHRLPEDSVGLESIAISLGFGSKEEFEREYSLSTSHVSRIYKKLFYEPSKRIEESGKEFWELADFLTEGNVAEEEALDSLQKLGFKEPGVAMGIMNVLLDPQRGGLTQRGRMLSRRVIPAFLNNIINSSEPDSALRNLERFVTSIGWRTSIFAVLAENPQILELLSKLFTTSGFLSNYLIRHPEYLDVLTLKDVRKEFNTEDEMVRELTGIINEESEYEDKLDAIRKFKNVETLKLCLRDLNHEVDSNYVDRHLSMIASACLEVALDLAGKVIDEEYGRYGSATNLVILGMGKLGGMEMSYNSDLDIIFIYHGDDQDIYSKLGRKIISILSIPTGEGFAYKIDMDLRPSGKAGALVSSFESFRKYHQESAKLWERQALIKARPAAGNIELGVKVMETVNNFVYDKPLRDSFYREIHHLRDRMEREIAKESTKKLNLKTGRGGLLDIEFLVQMLQLKFGIRNEEVRKQNTLEALNALKSGGLIETNHYQILNEGYVFLKRKENLLRLLHDRSISEIIESDFHKLSLELGMKGNGKKLKEIYINKTEKIRGIYEHYFS